MDATRKDRELKILSYLQHAYYVTDKEPTQHFNLLSSFIDRLGDQNLQEMQQVSQKESVTSGEDQNIQRISPMTSAKQSMELLRGKVTGSDLLIIMNHMMSYDIRVIEKLLSLPKIDLSSITHKQLSSWCDRNIRVKKDRAKIDVVINHLSKIHSIYSVNSPEDLDTVFRNMRSSNMVLIRPGSNYTYLMRMKFLPVTERLTDSFLKDYIIGEMNDETLNFWHGYDSESLNYVLAFEYISLEDAKNAGLSQCRSLPLILWSEHPNEYVYPQSQRPRNDMSMYKTVLHKAVPHASVIYSESDMFPHIIQDDVRWTLVPVTRYASGMKRGLFHRDDSVEQYCGTFYYMEKGSTTYLRVNAKNIYVSFNKTTALTEITNGLAHIEYNPTFSGTLEKQINGDLPADLILSPLDVASNTINTKIKETANISDQTPHYAGEKLMLYACEDELDQPLCNACRAHDPPIDVLFLTHMIGSHQIVSEVLDTRSREDSIFSLLYTY